MYRKVYAVSDLQTRHDRPPVRKGLLTEDKEVERPSSDVYRGQSPFHFNPAPVSPFC